MSKKHEMISSPNPGFLTYKEKLCIDITGTKAFYVCSNGSFKPQRRAKSKKSETNLTQENYLRIAFILGYKKISQRNKLFCHSV